MDLHKVWLMDFLQGVRQGWTTDGGIAEHQEITDSGELLVSLLGLKGQGKRMFFVAPEQARAVEVGWPDLFFHPPSIYCQSLLLVKPNQMAAG